MGVIKAARELGKAIQADERYIRFSAAREANDADADLQNKIGEFNLIRMQLSEEMNKEEGGDKDRITELNKRLRQTYSEIMVNETMIAYNAAKDEFDTLVREMNTIIDKSIGGEDPDTCDYEASCTGDCSACGGCH